MAVTLPISKTILAIADVEDKFQLTKTVLSRMVEERTFRM
jgi:hypothetical protein